MSLFRQSFFVPKPEITEKNVPNQAGKVHIVTGGYAGCGLELCKILYGADATVYCAGRSQEKADKAIETIKSAHPNSKGKIEFLSIDLSDLSTIKPAVESFTGKEDKLHVLTNNAGVMFPPKGSEDKHGHELQLGTNCLGPFLLTKLLTPLMDKTAAASEPNSVRVTWAASSAVDILSPKGGVEFDDSGKPKVLGVQTNYGQSKTGNVFLASESARRFSSSGVIHYSWNPGNLKTELQRNVPNLQNMVLNLILHEAIYGAYTELYAAVSPALTQDNSGAYIIPWGRIGSTKADVQKAVKPTGDGGTGQAQKFWDWCESETKQYS